MKPVSSYTEVHIDIMPEKCEWASPMILSSPNLSGYSKSADTVSLDD